MKFRASFKEQAVLVGLTTAAVFATLKATSHVKENQTQAIIDEQKEQIRKMTEQSNRCLAGTGGTGSTAPKSAPEQPDSPGNECVSGAEQNEMESELNYSDSVFCQFAKDPVKLATSHRNSCKDSEMLNQYIDKAVERCEAAKKRAKSQMEKDIFAKEIKGLEKLRINYRISPPQCAKITGSKDE